MRCVPRAYGTAYARKLSGDRNTYRLSNTEDRHLRRANARMVDMRKDKSMDVNGYLNYIGTPWGKLFYRLVWHELGSKNKKILDFGSGFGMTADHLASSNDVTAVEPNNEILEHRICENNYEQIMGGIEKLKEMQSESFDVIVCHNVLEYIENRSEVFEEFHRLLKNGGVLSVIKHNKKGRIMHKAVFENNIGEALSLINGENSISQNFGTINEYDIEQLNAYIDGKFALEKVSGIRIFYGLQPNYFKSEAGWEEKMFELECAAKNDPAFSDIAFFQHLFLKKIN